MNIEKITKASFTVIGLEGSTADGADFIPRLWAATNARFAEVQPLAKTDAAGNLCGVWGAMSSFARDFTPWEEHFTRGLYLAGIECADGAEAPAGWVKWVIPGYEYLRAACDEDDIFPKMLAFLQERNLPLAGAVQDFTDPRTGQSFMLFPIRRLSYT